MRFSGKTIKGVIFLTALLISSVIFAACSPAGDGLDLSGYTQVTYDCMGGHIDKMPVRVMYALPQTKLVEPKGSHGLVEPQRTNYDLVGWYTSYAADSYSPDVQGEYVYIDVYTLDLSNQGEYVGLYSYTEDEDGDFVYYENEYVFYQPGNQEHADLDRFAEVVTYELYDEQNPAHQGAPHFTSEMRYVFYDEQNPAHQNIQRYGAVLYFDEADRWNFSQNRIGTETMTLYARWEKKLTVVWNFNDGAGGILEYKNGVQQISILRGQPIPKTQRIPEKPGHTFTYWYKDAELTQLWDFAADVFPESADVSLLNLYAGHAEGSYTRVLSLSDLLRIKDNPAAKYLLLDDIALGSEDLSAVTFTGVLSGCGHTISGLSINASNTRLVGITRLGLFGAIQGAVIENLAVEGEIRVQAASSGELQLGAIAGADLGGSSIKNCNTNVRIYSPGAACSSNISAGAYTGRRAPDTVVQNSAHQSGYAGGILTTGVLTLAD